MNRVTVYKGQEYIRVYPIDSMDYINSGWSLKDTRISVNCEFLFVVEYIVGIETVLPVAKQLQEKGYSVVLWLYRRESEKPWFMPENESLLSGFSYTTGTFSALKHSLNSFRGKGVFLVMPPLHAKDAIAYLRFVSPESKIYTFYVGMMLSCSDVKGGLQGRSKCDYIFVQGDQSFDMAKACNMHEKIVVTGLPRFDKLKG